MVEFALTKRQLALRDKARKFAIEEMIPVAELGDREPDPARSFNWDVIRKADKLGLRTLSVPKEYGGGGADVMTLSMVGENLAYGDLGIAVAFDQTWKIMTMISHLTTARQRKKWLPRVMDDPTCLLAAAATEPLSGSDSILPYNKPDGGVRMTARKRGDKWILNGEKRYISNGGLAKVIYVMARTDMRKPPLKSMTGFLLTSDTPGYSVTEIWDKLGQRNVANGTMIFDNVEIPQADVMGTPNGALGELGALLTRFGSNIQAGATVLGVAQRAYDVTLQYAKQRVQGGKPIFEHQIQSQRLARMRMLIESARYYLWYSGWSASEGQPDAVAASLCKVNAAEASVKVLMEAFELWAATGYMKKNPIEKLLRDGLSFVHSDGTNDVLLLKASRLLGEIKRGDPRYSRRVELAAKGALGPDCKPETDKEIERMEVPFVSRDEMLANNVSRASEMRGSPLAFLDMRMPAHERENINIIGLNVTENMDDPALAPIVKAPAHGFSVGYIRAGNGRGAALHAHETEEVFIPIRGQWEIYWLAGEEEQAVTLDVGDVINVPLGIYRGFRCACDDPDALLLAVVGGPDPGKPNWHPSVLEAARETGLSVDDEGNLREDA